MLYLHADELITIQQTALKIAQESCSKFADEIDQDARWPSESMRALSEAGLTGLHIPQKCGGHGLGLQALTLACEMIALACPSTSMCFGMHCVASAVLVAKATSEQEEKYLVPIAAGEHLTTLALSETGTGAHFYFPQTELKLENGEYIINGNKSFVTNCGHVDSYVVSALVSAESALEGEFTCIAVDNETPGLTWLDPWDGLGLRGNSSRGMSLDNVHVPKTNLLGKEGDQIWYVFEVVAPYFLVAMAATYVGIAQAALDITLESTKSRFYQHSGSALANLDIIQSKLGVMYADVEKTRLLAYHAARLGDEGNPSALINILSSKAEAADTAVRVVNEALTICGGREYRRNGKLARLLRDARAAHVMAPTTDVLRIWSGRTLLGRPIL